jgi:hypothetical protein
VVGGTVVGGTVAEVDRAAEAARMAAQLADFAWAGLRQVHRI